jgi:hypothetical protein
VSRARQRTSIALLWLAAMPAYADGQVSVRDVLSTLVTHQDVPTADFAKDQQAAAATSDTVARALLIDLSTLPATTSAGGFSYRLNPLLGTVERITQSFGPFFVDRASTAGRSEASVSVTYQYANFVKLDGRNLADGTLQTTANKFRDEPAPFDVDALSLKLRTSTVTIFGNYGVTDQLDVGVAVPVVYLSMSGERVNTYRGTSVVQARGSATSFGLADLAIRSKLQLFRAGTRAVAADVEVGLPTGRPEDLRGAGKASLKTSVIGSITAGNFEAHVNGSAMVGGVSREATIAAAFVAAATPRVTLAGEAIVRRIGELHSIEAVTQPHPSIVGVDTIRLLPGNGGSTTIAVVGGLRWNLTSTLLMNTHVVFPLTERGLTTRPTPALSVDYSFIH